MNEKARKRLDERIVASERAAGRLLKVLPFAVLVAAVVLMLVLCAGVGQVVRLHGGVCSDSTPDACPWCGAPKRPIWPPTYACGTRATAVGGWEISVQCAIRQAAEAPNPDLAWTGRQ